jgi:hypothetical protein
MFNLPVIDLVFYTINLREDTEPTRILDDRNGKLQEVTETRYLSRFTNKFHIPPESGIFALSRVTISGMELQKGYKNFGEPHKVRM